MSFPLSTRSLSPEDDSSGESDHPYSRIKRPSDKKNSANDPFKLLPINRRIRMTKDVVLEWDNSIHRLRPWTWPTHNNITVLPKDLIRHRDTHYMCFPSCTCARDSTSPFMNTEAAVELKKDGPLKNCVIAKCARGKCKYWVNMTHVFFYKNANPTALFPVKEFPSRGSGDLPPQLLDLDFSAFDDIPSSSPASSFLLTPSSSSTPSRIGRKRRTNESAASSTSTAESSKRAGKRRRVERIDKSESPKITASSSLRKATPLPESEATPWNLLWSLDEKGLSMRDFQRLLVVCNLCEDWVGTPSSFETHYCPKHLLTADDEPFTTGAVIDLTGNNLDD